MTEQEISIFYAEVFNNITFDKEYELQILFKNKISWECPFKTKEGLVFNVTSDIVTISNKEKDFICSFSCSEIMGLSFKPYY